MKLFNSLFFFTILYSPLHTWGQNSLLTTCNNIIQSESNWVEKIKKAYQMNPPYDLACLETLNTDAKKNQPSLETVQDVQSFQMTNDEISNRILSLIESIKTKQTPAPPKDLILHQKSQGYKHLIRLQKNELHTPRSVTFLPQDVQSDIQHAYFHSNIQTGNYSRNPSKDTNHILTFLDLKKSEKKEFDNTPLQVAENKMKFIPVSYIFCTQYGNHKDVEREWNKQIKQFSRWSKENEYILTFYITALNIDRILRGYNSFYEFFDIHSLNYHQATELPEYFYDLVPSSKKENLKELISQVKYIYFLKKFLYEASSCYPYSFEEQISISYSEPFGMSAIQNSQLYEDIPSLSIKYELLYSPLLLAHSIHRQPHTIFDTSSVELEESTNHELNSRYSSSWNQNLKYIRSIMKQPLKRTSP